MSLPIADTINWEVSRMFLDVALPDPEHDMKISFFVLVAL